MPSTPLHKFLENESKYSQEVFLRQPFNGKWKEWTWKQAGDESRSMAASLLALNIPRGSHIAILSKNCAHWVMADIAIMMAGCVSVPLYATLSGKAIQPILKHSDTKAIFIGKLDDFASQTNGIPSNITRISFDDYGINETYTWNELIAQHQPLEPISNPSPTDLFTIIYTSGTTGTSKGVMHTFGNFDTVLNLAIAEVQLPHRSVLFSYLPMSHIAERIGIELNGIYSASVISFAESIDTFAANVQEIQPHVFFAVPRLWGKFREGILKKMPEKKLKLFLSIPVLNNIIRKKIKHALGLSRATHIYSASAPISVDWLKWFDQLGITILQALGMTEDCVYAHFERPFAHRFGSVGKPLTGMHVKITEEGELRVKSTANTIGYYKEPQLTAELFDEDGYLKTGDICEYDHDGFLFVTGRLKDHFKTDKGKYIAPTPIETKLLANTDIENTCVVGTGIPQPIALITLSEMGKTKSKEEINESLVHTMNTINPLLEHHEKLEKAVVMKETWSIENGLLTPTLKVKRNQVEKIHQQFYPLWFEKKENVIWE
ncbi:MAG: AMP-binding protein [Chitinophagaceae bacterium]|nr:AMP-binding protein [Chitinophagaceae bacterium]